MADSMYSRRLFARAVLVLSLPFFAAHISYKAKAAEPWRIETIKLTGVPERLYFREGKAALHALRVLTRDGKLHFLKRCNDTYCANQTSNPYVPPRLPAGALPDAVQAIGARNIRSAWLASPTRRYDHGILGDAVEAGSMVAIDERRKRLVLELGADSVFEDRKVRLADMDGDGKDEMISVRSYLDRGASISIVKQSGHGLEIKAETPPIGRSHRWLNPAGIADFDGDGRLEIAIVVTPHIGGTLEFWEYRDGKMVREMQLRGFSNHVIGSRVQGMSAVADFDGDGIMDLAVPADGQRMIRIISFAKGAVAEIARINLPGRIVSQILALRLDGAKRQALTAGLDNGVLAIIR